MPRSVIPLLACLALASGTAFAGCGDDEESTSPPAAPPPAAQEPAETEGAEPSGDTVAVGIKNIKFMPENVTAKVGQKIVWTNNEPVVHNVTATDGADFKSDDLDNGDTFEYTTEQAGKIAYVCTIHPGQNGSITVTE